MNFDSLSADPFGHTGLAVKNAGISKVAQLTPWHRHHRPAAAHTAAMLAFALGLVVAALGAAAADEPARPQPTVERAGTDIVRFRRGPIGSKPCSVASRNISHSLPANRRLGVYDEICLLPPGPSELG